MIDNADRLAPAGFNDSDQIEIVRRFGGKVYFGDASRADILEAAQIDKARAFVVCVSNVEASLRIVELVRSKYPDLPIYARARDRLLDAVLDHRLVDERQHLLGLGLGGR